MRCCWSAGSPRAWRAVTAASVTTRLSSLTEKRPAIGAGPPNKPRVVMMVGSPAPPGVVARGRLARVRAASPRRPVGGTSSMMPPGVRPGSARRAAARRHPAVAPATAFAAMPGAPSGSRRITPTAVRRHGGRCRLQGRPQRGCATRRPRAGVQEWREGQQPRRLAPEAPRGDDERLGRGAPASTRAAAAPGPAGPGHAGQPSAPRPRRRGAP